MASTYMHTTATRAKQGVAVVWGWVKPYLAMVLAFVSKHRIPFLMFGMGCFVAGMFMPFVHIVPGENAGFIEGVLIWFFSDEDTYTLPQGVFAICERSLFLGVPAVLFSLVLPICKMVLLAYCCMTKHDTKNLHKWLERIGPWSMLEIFVMGLSLLAMQTLPLGIAVHPKPGSILFLVSVFVSMLISQTPAPHQKAEYAGPRDVIL